MPFCLLAFYFIPLSLTLTPTHSHSLISHHLLSILYTCSLFIFLLSSKSFLFFHFSLLPFLSFVSPPLLLPILSLIPPSPLPSPPFPFHSPPPTLSSLSLLFLSTNPTSSPSSLFDSPPLSSRSLYLYPHPPTPFFLFPLSQV